MPAGRHITSREPVVAGAVTRRKQRSDNATYPDIPATLTAISTIVQICVADGQCRSDVCVAIIDSLHSSRGDVNAAISSALRRIPLSDRGRRQAAEALDQQRLFATSGTVTDAVGALDAGGCPGRQLAEAVAVCESVNHIRLVWKLAEDMHPHMKGRWAADDLVGFGWLGLRSALLGYDPQSGFTLATYATRRIRGAIQDGVRQDQPVPKRLQTTIRKISASEAELAQELGRPVTLEEAVEHAGVAVDRIIWERCKSPLSFDWQPDDDGQRSFADMIDAGALDRLDGRSTIVDADQQMLRSDIAAAFAQLDQADAYVMRRVTVDGLSHREVSAETGETPRKVAERAQRARSQLAGLLHDYAPAA